MENMQEIKDLQEDKPQLKKGSIKGVRLPEKAKVLGVVFLLLVSAATGFAGGLLGSRGNQNLSTNHQAQQQIVSSESQLISNIVKKVGPSVVSVNVIGQSAQPDVFGFTRSVQQQSAGTGIIINSAGIVMTNRHVVPVGTNSVTVTLSDGTTLDNVEVVGRTNDSDPLDVAFLKIKDKKGKTLTPAVLGDSAKAQVGDRVVAIGNALGQFQNTVTSGIISGYGRSVQAGNQTTTETLQNLFQTDAAINEGNSGGPLVNMGGEVIGLNTALAGGAQNIGFAIPVNDLKGVIKSVLNSGKLERPYLGIRYINLDDNYASQLNLPVKRGAYIVPGSRGQASIIAGSPAEKAGLKEKDIITKVDNKAVDEKNNLTSLISSHNVGDSVTLTILRDGKEQKINVKLEAAPNG